MKNFILIIVFFCFVQIVEAQTLFPPEAVSNLKELGIKGHVKELIEYSYSAKYDDNDTSKKRWKTIFEFDQQGNLLSEIVYSPHGRITSKSLYNYTKKDTVTISQFDYTNKLANKLILKYDDRGMLIESDQYNPPIVAPTFKTTFKYDVKGNEIENDLYFGNGSLAQVAVIFYGRKNQKTEEDFTGKFAINNKTVYKYDELGYLIEEETINKDDSAPTIELKYAKHDKYGNWLMKVYVNDPQGKAAAIVIKELTKANIKATKENFKNKQITTREIKYF